MKTNCTKFVMCKTLLLVMAILTMMIIQTAYCRDYESNGYALMVQQSPANAGFITPQAGVHRATANEALILTAIPKPGYRFVYWLGDVSDASANQTTIFVDAPKIVVAVFERIEHEFLLEIDMVRSGSGQGGLRRSSNNVRMGPSINPPIVYEVPDRPGFTILPRNDMPLVPDDGDSDSNNNNDDFQVPGNGNDGNDFLVPGDEPIPEPTTIAIFGLGAVWQLMRRKRTHL